MYVSMINLIITGVLAIGAIVLWAWAIAGPDTGRYLIGLALALLAIGVAMAWATSPKR